MSEETQGQTAPGADGNSPASESQQQGESTQEFVSKAEFDAGLKRIEELVSGSTERIKQSQRDAIKDRTEGIEARILKQVAPVLEKAGVSLDDERRKAGLDILAERFLDDPAEDPSLPQAEDSTSQASDTPASPESLLIDSLLKESGLTRETPEVSKWLSELPAGRTLGGITRELTEMIEEIGAREEPTGDIAVLGGASPSHQSKLEELVKGYREEALKARGQGMHALRKIQDKYRKMGLQNPHEVPLEEWVPLDERTPKL